MSRTFLATVGTSLQTNARREGVEPADENLRRRLKADPVAASAESNALSRLMQSGDRVVFFHSATDEGRQCARVLAAHFSGSAEELPGLAFSTGEFAGKGLRSLVQVLSGHIRRARRDGREPVLVPLGGFKAQTAYATVIGLLFQIPMYYIAENVDQLIALPPTPLSWDMSLLIAHEPFFDWLDAEPRATATVAQRLKAVGEDAARLRPLLEEAEDGNTYLSALGEAYFRAFQGEAERLSAEPIRFSVTAQRAYGALEPSVRADFDRVLRRLSQPVLRRAGSKTLERTHGDASVFPQGHVDERVFYVERAGEVLVLEIARHGRDYEALYQSKVFAKDYETGALWASS